MRFLRLLPLLLLALLAATVAGQESVPEGAPEDAAAGESATTDASPTVVASVTVVESVQVLAEPTAEPGADAGEPTTAEPEAVVEFPTEGVVEDATAEPAGADSEAAENHHHQAEENGTMTHGRSENVTEWEMVDDNSTFPENSTDNSTMSTTPPSVTVLPGNDTTLACWVCSTALEPLCADPFDHEAAKEAGFLIDCHDQGELHAVCRKQAQMVPGDSRTIRACGHNKDVDELGCYYTSEGLTASRVCHCAHDGCNGAGVGRAVAALVLAAAALSATWW